MVEADFQREYGIDLSKEIDNMSWRRFVVLLQNLSTNSIYVMHIRYEIKEAEDTMSDAQGINLLKSMCGGEVL